MQVALFYGMSQPGASDTPAAHATFAIDPLWILRAMLYYAMSNGLSFNEFLRFVEALQTSDAHGVATPEAWQPSDEVVVTPLNSVRMRPPALRDRGARFKVPVMAGRSVRQGAGDDGVEAGA
jgi:alkyl hydroperoxide reductase subunit AhpC